MVPNSYDPVFGATAGVAGALIGLLFVAISVAQDRLQESRDTQIHRIRASASLTAFTNALVVSLFALIPGTNLGQPTLYVSVIGFSFVVGSLLSIIRVAGVSWRHLTDLGLMVGLTATFVYQLVTAIRLLHDDHHDGGKIGTLATLVVVCFLIGIARAWELVGGPRIGLIKELHAVAQDHDSDSVRDRP